MNANLGCKKIGGRLCISIIRRDMDISVNIIFRNSFCNPLGALHMYVFICEVPGYVQ